MAAFGKEGYGEWLTLFGIASYVSMADVGIEHYWLNLLTGAHVRGDINKYKQIFRAGLFMFLAVACLVLIISVVFSFLRGPSRVLDLEYIGPFTASVVFLVLVGSTLLAVFSRMVRGVFRTVGQYPKVVWFEATREAMTFVCITAALLLGMNKMGLAWVYGGIAVLMMVWVLLTVRGRFDDLVDFRIHKADRKTVTGLLGGGSINLLSALANLLLVQGTLILTNWALGAAVVALVATSRTLANLVRQAAGSVYLATLPEFSRLEAAGDTWQMESLLRRGTSLGMVISGVAVIALVGLGPWLFDIWTDGRFTNTAPLIYLFAASVIVDALRLPLHDFIMGCNRIATVAIANIAYAVSSLVVMWILFPRFGAWSVPISTMACGAVIHLPVMIFGTRRILGTRGLIGPGRAVVFNPPALGLLAAVLYYSKKLFPSIAATAAIVALAILLYALISWKLTFTSEDRSAIAIAIKRRFSWL